MDLSKFSDGRVNFRNSGVKGLMANISMALRALCVETCTYIFAIIIIASCNIVSTWSTTSTICATRWHPWCLNNHLWLHHNLRWWVLWRFLCDCGQWQIWWDSSWILHFTTWLCCSHRKIANLFSFNLWWVFWRWGWDSFSIILWTYLQKRRIPLTLKLPRKPASENAVCLCRLLNILANCLNLFLPTSKQCGPWSDCS